MTLSRRWVRGAVWVVLLMAGSLLARAQEVSGSISGTVMDAKGASVSGAVVTLTNTDRAHVERTLKTDKAGYYVAGSLPLGNYSVGIAMREFKTVAITGLVLHANGELQVDQRLEAGSSGETVTVVASQAPVNLRNGMSEGLVTGTQVRDLPLLNRNYEQLLTLQPGVTNGGSADDLYLGASLPYGTLSAPIAQTARGLDPFAPNEVLFSVNGERPSMNDWTLDGADNVDRGTGLTLLSYPSVDAISEFVTLRGTYDAEYGRNGGAQINVITRSGSNGFHGGGYEFFRNNALNANNYFNKLSSPITPRPRLEYNDFGFTAGGPVVIPHLYNGRDKTFFFYSQEFRRVENYTTSTSYVPTQLERQGNFGSGTSGSAVCVAFNPGTGSCQTYTNQVPGASISTASTAYLGQIYTNIASPNPGKGQDPHSLTANLRNVFHDNQEIVRIDHALGSRVNVYYRFLHEDLPTVEGGGLFVGGGMPGVSTTQTISPGTQHLAHMTIAERPTLLFDMGYAYSSGSIHSNPDYGFVSTASDPNFATNATTATAVQLPYPSTLGVIPSLTFAGVSGGTTETGIASAGLYNEYSRNHNGFGIVTKVIREHTFKFGLTYNHYQKMENAIGTGSSYPQGNFTFNPATISATQLQAQNAANGTSFSQPSPFDAEWANFLIGNANGGFTQASQSMTPDINENLFEMFLQDDWKASRRLTLNLGVRYSYFGQPYDVNNELSNFEPSTYSVYHAETIASNGSLCTLAGQTTELLTFTAVGVAPQYTLTFCPNVNGLNAYTPSSTADPLNGLILGDSSLITAEQANGINNPGYPYAPPGGAPAIITHGSPFGLEVGQAEKHDFAPRVGFAYDLFGDGTTALRGGYGLVYDNGSVSAYEQEVFNNPPYVYVNTYASAIMNKPAIPVNALPFSLAPSALYATPLIYQTPYVQQFSLDVQRSIGSTMIVDVGYFGDHGTHLQGRVDINENMPGAFTKTSISYAQQAGCSGFTSQACEGPLNQIRPYPGYTAINSVENIFNQNYNSLQAKLTKRFSGKTLVDVNYTYQRGLTNAASDLNSAPQNTYNLKQEYGPTAYNRNHVLTVDAIWDLPWMRSQEGIAGHILGGWELSGIYSYSTGQPLTATMTAGGTVSYGGLASTYNGQTNGGVANDSAGLGIVGASAASLRPQVVLNPNSGAGFHSHLHWFNPTAFVAPPPTSYQVGNERPGQIAGPPDDQLDAAIIRDFKLYHGWVFTLRGEGFNVINHVNWGVIDTSATSGTFGQPTSTRTPRVLQVAGKINF